MRQWYISDEKVETKEFLGPSELVVTRHPRVLLTAKTCPNPWTGAYEKLSFCSQRACEDFLAANHDWDIAQWTVERRGREQSPYALDDFGLRQICTDMETEATNKARHPSHAKLLGSAFKKYGSRVGQGIPDDRVRKLLQLRRVRRALMHQAYHRWHRNTRTYEI